MRGTFEAQGGLFSYVAPEARVPANHPLRKIRALVRCARFKPAPPLLEFLMGALWIRQNVQRSETMFEKKENVAETQQSVTIRMVRKRGGFAIEVGRPCP
jgi:hypothetical protein